MRNINRCSPDLCLSLHVCHYVKVVKWYFYFKRWKRPWRVTKAGLPALQDSVTSHLQNTWSSSPCLITAPQKCCSERSCDIRKRSAASRLTELNKKTKKEVGGCWCSSSTGRKQMKAFHSHFLWKPCWLKEESVSYKFLQSSFVMSKDPDELQFSQCCLKFWGGDKLRYQILDPNFNV